MTFKPAPSSDGRRGLTAIAGLLVAMAGLVWLMLSRPVDLGSFLLLILALALLGVTGLVAWRTWLCLSLSYWVDRNAVTIAWGPLRQAIPLSQIERVQRGATESPSSRWVDRWPWLEPFLVYGPELGRVHQVVSAQVLSLATRPLPEQLLLCCVSGIYGISPAAPDRFLEALASHHALGPTRMVAADHHLPRLMRLPIWRDRPGLALLASGFFAWLMILGLLMARYPAIPPAVDVLGGVQRDFLFLLPGFSVTVWVVNGLWGALVHGRYRIAALLLWGGTLLAQIPTLVALLQLVS